MQLMLGVSLLLRLPDGFKHAPGVLRMKSSSLLGLLACCRCVPCVLLRLCWGTAGGLTVTGVLLLLRVLLLLCSGRFKVPVLLLASLLPLTVRRA